MRREYWRDEKKGGVKVKREGKRKEEREEKLRRESKWEKRKRMIGVITERQSRERSREKDGRLQLTS